MFSVTTRCFYKAKELLRYSHYSIRKICVVQLRLSSSLTSKPYHLSYAHHGSDIPLTNWTLGEMFDLNAEVHKNREILVFKEQNIRKTFGELKEDVYKLSLSLLALGLKPGNFVGIWSFNCYEWVVVQFAVSKCGMTVVNLSAVNQIKETDYCLKKVSVHALIVSDTIKMFDYYKILCEVIPNLPSSKPGALNSDKFPTLKHIIMLSDKEYKGTWKYPDVLKMGKSGLMKELESILVEPDSTCNIMFTSGTTGLPKAAVNTHHSLLNNAVCTMRRLETNENSIVCVPLPMFHTFGCALGIVACAAFGFKSVFPSPIFVAKIFVETIASEKCTMLFGTPTMYIDLLNLPGIESYDLSSVKILITGGSEISIEIGRALQKHFNCPVINGYGATETACASIIPKLTDQPEVQLKRGYPVDHFEVKIVDDKGNLVPKNVHGELLLRGYPIMPEYWQDPAKTEEVLTKTRWFKSGDQAVMDDAGNVEIIARRKDIIFRGGENIYPKEIENYLLTNPNIAEVQVFSVPDKRYGQEICAWVKLKPDKKLTKKELRDFCKGQIAHIKIPRYVMFVETFPKSAAGKYLKNVMQDESVKKLKSE